MDVNRLGRLRDKAVPAAAVALLLVILLSSSFVTVGPGDRGVLMTFGSVQPGVLSPGLHMKLPLVQTVKQLDVRIQKDEAAQTASSRDLQDVTTTVAVNWSIQPEDVQWVYQNIGDEQMLVNKMLNPVISNSVKAVTARYDAEDLIAKRDEVRQAIETMITKGVTPYKILVENVSITNFRFSPEYSQAIEAKQVAQQKAQQAQYELQRTKVEAEQQVARASGQAQAQKLIQQTLTPEIIQFDAVQKWDGHLPQAVGGSGVLPMLGTLSPGSR